LVDIQTVSIAVASASVVLATIYYIWQIGHQTKLRQTDLIMRLQSTWLQSLRESYETVMKMKYEDYGEYAKKYPLWKGVGTPETRAVAEVCSFFDGIGILLHRRLIDVEMVDELFSVYIKDAWEKLKPGIEGLRRERYPTLRKWFEYLYNELKKREQKLQAKKD
jgi:hypothetical protein